MECLSSPRRNGLRSGCPSRHLKQSMRTASTPDKWNVSHRPVVYGHLFTVLSQRQSTVLSRISILSVIGIRLTFVHQFTSRFGLSIKSCGQLSVVGICLMSLFTYIASLSRFLVRLVVGKHCGWSSETATPSRFLRVGFV